MTDTDDRVKRLERLVLNLGETMQDQQEEIRELRQDLAQARADLKQVAADARGARYLAGAALDV